MTEAHRRAQATYVKARRDKGDQKLTFWFAPNHLRALDRLAKVTGSRQKALEKLLELMEADPG